MILDGLRIIDKALVEYNPLELVSMWWQCTASRKICEGHYGILVRSGRTFGKRPFDPRTCLASAQV